MTFFTNSRNDGISTLVNVECSSDLDILICSLTVTTHLEINCTKHQRIECQVFACFFLQCCKEDITYGLEPEMNYLRRVH